MNNEIFDVDIVPATVTKVDPNLGRFGVKYDSAGGEKAVRFGNMMAK